MAGYNKKPAAGYAHSRAHQSRLLANRLELHSSSLHVTIQLLIRNNEQTCERALYYNSTDRVCQF